MGKKLGEGAFGSVYRATSLKPNSKVCTRVTLCGGETVLSFGVNYLNSIGMFIFNDRIKETWY